MIFVASGQNDVAYFYNLEAQEKLLHFIAFLARKNLFE
jgi:hypothetical protein